MDNGYYIWSFQGKLLQRHALDQFCSLLWRPRPPTLLTEADIKVRYWWWIRLCCLLPGKPASLSSCEGSLLSLCHFFCLYWWLWIKTSFSCWHIFLFVKSFLMPRTSQPGICSGGILLKNAIWSSLSPFLGSSQVVHFAAFWSRCKINSMFHYRAQTITKTASAIVAPFSGTVFLVT